MWALTLKQPYALDGDSRLEGYRESQLGECHRG